MFNIISCFLADPLARTLSQYLSSFRLSTERVVVPELKQRDDFLMIAVQIQDFHALRSYQILHFVSGYLRQVSKLSNFLLRIAGYSEELPVKLAYHVFPGDAFPSSSRPAPIKNSR